MSVVRVLPSSPECWAMYPKLEARMRDFVARYDLTCPIDAVLQEMRQRWINQPELCGYFLSIDGGFINGHLISWVGSAYGINKLYVYQAEMSNGLAPMKETKDAVISWISALNEKTNEPFKVKKAEWVTWFEPAVWKRYLEKVGIKVENVRQVLNCEL